MFRYPSSHTHMFTHFHIQLFTYSVFILTISRSHSCLHISRVHTFKGTFSHVHVHTFPCSHVCSHSSRVRYELQAHTHKGGRQEVTRERAAVYLQIFIFRVSLTFCLHLNRWTFCSSKQLRNEGNRLRDFF